MNYQWETRQELQGTPDTESFVCLLITASCLTLVLRVGMSHRLANQSTPLPWPRDWFQYGHVTQSRPMKVLPGIFCWLDHVSGRLKPGVTCCFLPHINQESSLMAGKTKIKHKRKQSQRWRKRAESRAWQASSIQAPRSSPTWIQNQIWTCQSHEMIKFLLYLSWVSVTYNQESWFTQT